MTVQSQTLGVPGEGGAYIDQKVPRRLLPVARQSLRLNTLPGEFVLGIFASTRIRRSITLLVVTDRRLLTLGDQHVGMPVVDEVDRQTVRTVHIEREKVFSTGAVTAETDLGGVNLGTLAYGAETFNRLEQILARTDPRPMPVIPAVAGGGGTEPPQDDVPSPRSGRPGARSGDPGARSDHPLVVHLTALADLHERGALTDEEFAAAKARLLADPEG